MDQDSEIQKLNPYAILDSDPIFNNLNSLDTLPRYNASVPENGCSSVSNVCVYGIKKSQCPIDNLQSLHSNLYQTVDHDSERRIELNSYSILDTDPRFNKLNLSDTLPRDPNQKTDGSSSIENSHSNNQRLNNKELIDFQNHKTVVNNAQIIYSTPKVKETLAISKELKEDNTSGCFSPKTKLIVDSYDISIKNQAKLSVINTKTIVLKTKKRIGITNNTNNKLLVNSWNNNVLNASMELTTENTLIVQTLSKNIEQDVMNNEPNKLFANAPKYNYVQHLALRSSLFSNMPPYIRFFSHDVKGESFPLPLQKLLKWKLNSITPIVIRRTIKNSGFKLVKKSNDWVGMWGKHMKSVCFKTLQEQQKLNHFPGTFQIGRKDKLWKNLHGFMLKFGKEKFGFIPTSYILPQETRLLRQVWKKNDVEKWIIKPPASARGTGIRVISKWNQIPKKEPLVVQKYIGNPYLINESKFDLRLYLLITSINPLRLYLYDNGLVRFASVKYSSDLNTISDLYMHLTNYSINRLSSQYTQNEDANACQGHKWTLKSLWTYMENERKIEVKKLWDSLIDLVVKTVISGESPISQMCCSNLSNRYNGYELFGIDVLFDEFLKPWLLEVNISPSLHSSSPLDLAVKGPLVTDIMNMVGYHIPNKMPLSACNSLQNMLGVNSPLCYDARLYTYKLSVKEREKQEYYSNIESRKEYIDSILDNLLPDDVRHLIIYEDELTQIGSFQKVFPTSSSHKYHQYFNGTRYYNMLLDAWESKYSNKREEGIAVLEKLCQSKVHLNVSDIDEESSKVFV